MKLLYIFEHFLYKILENKDILKIIFLLIKTEFKKLIKIWQNSKENIL